MPIDLNVQSVVVQVHEKRNHPYEYGHYDCQVTLEARVADDRSLDVQIAHLRDKAAAHVRDHLGAWIAGIEREREEAAIEAKWQQLENRIAIEIDQFASLPMDKWEARRQMVMELIEQLPEDWHDGWERDLDARIHELALDPDAGGER